MGEFELIRRYFSDCGARRADIAVGVGDDCALLRPDSARLLAVSIDTLVAGVHFFPEVAPDALGHKALAVNLSDLAAMGAEPAWFTLALTLPASDPDWLAAFADGLCGLARRFGIRLVGGDTTRGPLAITLQVHGWVAQERVLSRQGARPGDWVCVTGSLGEAALALRLKYSGEAVPEILQQRLDRPWPRVAEGLALGGLAHAAIDLSDGLAADLGHVLAASGVGARLRLVDLPRSPKVQATGDWALALAGGDDYELCLTLAPERFEEARTRLAALGCPLTAIGQIEVTPGLRLEGPEGQPITLANSGYDHFG